MSNPTEPEIALGGEEIEPVAQHAAPNNLAMTALQVGFFVAVSVILNTVVSTFVGVKSGFLLKDVLQLSPTQVTGLNVVLGIPGYLRPFMGAGADLFPLFGFHRKSYYCLSWFIYAAGYLAISFTPIHSYSVAGVAICLLMFGAGSNLLFVIIDSIMVSIGNQTGSIGRLQGIQQGIPLLLGFVAGPLSGHFAQQWTYHDCYLWAGLTACFGGLITLLIFEQPADSRYEHHPNTLAERHKEKMQDKRDLKTHAAIMRKTALSPGLWICVVYVFYLIITPGVNTAQFYYQVNVLHFSKQFLGDLGVPGSAGSVLGVLLFLFVGRKLPTAVIVWGAFLGDLSVYPMLFFLHNHESARIITFAGALTGQIYNLCLLTFAAKSCPKGIEASVYGLFVAAVGLAGTLGELLGSYIYSYGGPPHHSVIHGWYTLLVCGIVMTAAGAFIIPFLPRWARDAKYEREQLATAL